MHSLAVRRERQKQQGNRRVAFWEVIEGKHELRPVKKAADATRDVWIACCFSNVWACRRYSTLSPATAPKMGAPMVKAEGKGRSVSSATVTSQLAPHQRYQFCAISSAHFITAWTFHCQKGSVLCYGFHAALDIRVSGQSPEINSSLCFVATAWLTNLNTDNWSSPSTQRDENIPYRENYWATLCCYL